MSSNNFQMGHCEDCIKHKCDIALLKRKNECLEEVKTAALALVRILEFDKDVKENNWWLNERAGVMEAISDE